MKGELLGIDLGTLSAKVGLFSREGHLLTSARGSYPLRRDPEHGIAEQDLERWWEAVRDAIREVLRDQDPRDLRAICVGGQGPTLVLVDDEGRAVRPAISWMDTRAEAQSRRLAEAVGSNRVAYSLAPPLLWVAEHEPTTLARTRWALQSWDAIGLRLAGGRVAAASTFGGDRVWSPSWLAASGLDGSPIVPPHVDAGEPYATTDGPWAAEAGLPMGVPIVGGVNDGIGSIVGAAGGVVGRATDPGGASGGLALCWDRPLQGAGLDVWPGLVSGTSIVGGAFAAGGRAVDWWAAIGAERDVPRALALAEQAPAGSQSLVFLPFLAGERSPIWDAEARGVFLGLGLEHDARHLSRAVVEGTAFALRLLAEAVEQAGGQIDDLRVCGGQARSRFWNQVKADVSGYRVLIPATVDVALMSDAVFAALGAGFYPDVVTAGEAMVRIAETLEPTPAHRAVYDQLFAIYRAAYPTLKPLFADLADVRATAGRAE